MRLNTKDGTVSGLIAVPETHLVSVTDRDEPMFGVRPNRIFWYQQQPSPYVSIGAMHDNTVMTACRPRLCQNALFIIMFKSQWQGKPNEAFH